MDSEITEHLTTEIAESLFDGYTRTWSESRYAKINSGAPNEPDISAIIAALINEPGRAATDYLCEAGGHRPDRHAYDYYLTNDADDFVRKHLRRRNTTDDRNTRIRPDIFVSRCPAGTESSELVVAIELKGSAWVNYIHCPTGAHPEYSNQLVCYPQGCWLEDPLAHPHLSYVWLAPERKLTDVAIEARALSNDPARLARLNATWPAYQRQVEALATMWHRAALEGLVEKLQPSAPGLARVVGDWANRLA